MLVIGTLFLLFLGLAVIACPVIGGRKEREMLVIRTKDVSEDKWRRDGEQMTTQEKQAKSKGNVIKRFEKWLTLWLGISFIFGFMVLAYGEAFRFSNFIDSVHPVLGLAMISCLLVSIIILVGTGIVYLISTIVRDDEEDEWR
ncbi:hypothetical protein [Sporolactobacillus sp. KGMB 08714]|uniref:hypothetical protein n=1 Tax=Sporolactobacillus sp. KGMB 08714 TaxID=3064704 RepID=UPI002FBDE1D2